MEVKKIVFPVNLAGSSYRIAPSARFLADQFDAELHIIYVMESLEGFSTFLSLIGRWTLLNRKL